MIRSSNVSAIFLLLSAIIPMAQGAASPEAKVQPPESATGSASGDTTRAGKPPAATGESMEAWQWLFDVVPTQGHTSPWQDFQVTNEVFGVAQPSLTDLRLLDAKGHEIPYAMRIRRTRHEQESLPTKSFNERKHPEDRTVETSLDLGEKPTEYQEIQVLADGTEFRRRVQVEASDNSHDWGVLASGWLIHYHVASGQTIDQDRLHFAPSRSRYLRIRVSPDLSQSDDSPAIVSLHVFHTIEIPGEYRTLQPILGPREPVPAYGGPGSAWMLDLGADAVPCEKLTLDITDPEFVRPYNLELVQPEGGRTPIVQGELRRRPGEERKPIEITFPEVAAHRLRLVVTDYRNPALNLQRVDYTSPVRQVVFPHGKNLPEPVRLYAGNPKAQPPHYDFAANLRDVLQPPPDRTALGPRAANPTYRPIPKPWTERWPALVYVVLGTASGVLLVLLILLARGAVARRTSVEAATSGG